MQLDLETPLTLDEQATSGLLICLLGAFAVLKAGRPLVLPSGGKAEGLLTALALRPEYTASRDALLGALWPNGEAALAGQSLSSLVYSLNRLLGAGDSAPPAVLHENGSYRLNAEAGVAVDVGRFDGLIRSGDLLVRLGSSTEAAACYSRAVELYRGDLSVDSDLRAVVERERLRAAFLTILARLADYSYGLGDYCTCLEYALRLLLCDPCREDAHRLAMRCYVRRGERAQALRQYHLCIGILQSEFDAPPEQATTALFDQIRLAPDSV